jgi:hypothetical protein
MTTAQRIVQDWTTTRTFRQKTFRSSSNPSLTYTTTIFWGGTMEDPNINCTCPRFVYQGRRCSHRDEMWNELSQFTKNDIVHHDEIVAKPWYHPKQQ